MLAAPRTMELSASHRFASSLVVAVVASFLGTYVFIAVFPKHR